MPFPPNLDCSSASKLYFSWVPPTIKDGEDVVGYKIVDATDPSAVYFDGASDNSTLQGSVSKDSSSSSNSYKLLTVVRTSGCSSCAAQDGQQSVAMSAPFWSGANQLQCTGASHRLPRAHWLPVGASALPDSYECARRSAGRRFASPPC